MTDHLIKTTTALVLVAVAGVAAIISYQDACELVTRTARRAQPPTCCRSPWTAKSGQRPWWY
jgi:hypothetical protein